MSDMGEYGRQGQCAFYTFLLSKAEIVEASGHIHQP